MADEPTRFFIVHLQKAAGTSLRDRFRATLDDPAIYPNATDGRDKRLSVISLAHLLERWRVRRDEIRLVAGHFPLSTVELLDADFVTLSILRPPVDRTLSYSGSPSAHAAMSAASRTYARDWTRKEFFMEFLICRGSMRE